MRHLIFFNCLFYSTFAYCATSDFFTYQLWQVGDEIPTINASNECQTPIAPFTGVMDFTSKFEGSSFDKATLDQAALQKYEEAIKSIRALESATVTHANRYVKTGHAYFRGCVIAWLGNWAKAKAMLDPSANATGQFVRKWALGSIALAALQTRQNGEALPVPIQHWLRRLAEQVLVDFDLRPIEKHNNHDYWAAWSIALSGVLLDDLSMYNWALAQWHIGVQNINGGFLPKELARKSRALEYHNYALQPLFFIADLACEQGQPALLWHEKLHKLIDRVARGMKNPTIFAEKTGYQQVTDKLYSKTNMAWWHRYKARFGQPLVNIDEFLYLSAKSTRLGGDLALLQPPSDCLQ